MDQRKAPRTSWSLNETKFGKPYIVSKCTHSSSPLDSRSHRSPQDHGNDQKTIGYNITHTHNIVGMACAIGPKHKVWNIGSCVV